MKTRPYIAERLLMGRKESNQTNKFYQQRFTLFTFIFNPCHAEYYLCTTLLPNFYGVNLQQSNCEHVFSIRAESNVDHDQMASLEAS